MLNLDREKRLDPGVKMTLGGAPSSQRLECYLGLMPELGKQPVRPW